MSHSRKSSRGQPRRINKGYMNKMVKAKVKRIKKHPSVRTHIIK